MDEYNGAALETAAKLNAVPLLRAMLQGRAVSSTSLSRAFKSADRERLEVVKIFLDAGIRGDLLHAALVEQSKRGDHSLDVCSCFLQHGASVNEYNGEALNTTIRLGAVQLAQVLLLERKATSTTLSRAFNSALEFPDSVNLRMLQLLFNAGLQKGDEIHGGLLKLVQFGSKDTEIIQGLLKFGASVHYDNHNALKSAALLCNHSVLEVLFPDRNLDTSQPTRSRDLAPPLLRLA